MLNLGTNFSLPKDLWTQLCSRINDIITGQLTFDNHQPEEIETVAQHIAARMIANRSESNEVLKKEKIDYQEVDVESLELVRPRSISVLNLPARPLPGRKARNPGEALPGGWERRKSESHYSGY